MADVDFISYRDDLAGNDRLRADEDPMRVYLTWRAGAAKAGNARMAVAVEFLPKQ